MPTATTVILPREGPLDRGFDLEDEDEYEALAREFYQNVVQREASEDSLDQANLIALSQPDC